MFSRSKTTGYILLVDIGSGSVGMSIISDDQSAPAIWSHREHTTLKVTKSINESSKAVITALMQAMMMFETVGRPALQAHQASARIAIIQATVAAPWSYTVARTIAFNNDESFLITSELLSDLAAAAAEQAMDEFSAKHSLQSLGVEETSRTILDAHANGYRISAANKQRAAELNVTHVSTLVRTEIIASLQDMQEKLLPAASLQVTSYMLANYYVVQSLPNTDQSFCLVDVTNEATELGIVRKDALQYCTHTSFGRASLAREVAAATNVPLHEAFTSLRTLDATDVRQTDITVMLNAYQTKIEELFTETGDTLTIPKHIYLQTDAGLTEFFTPLIEAAGEAASKGSVLVTPMNASLLGNATIDNNDIALQIAASFFHTKETRTYFQYL